MTAAVRDRRVGVGCWRGMHPAGTLRWFRTKGSYRSDMKTIRVCALVAVLLLGIASAQTYVELILDASGSMWHQLEGGEYRIAAAKAALTDFVSSLPADDELHVGLRVYGSRLGARDEGACLDSELLVEPAGLDRDTLLRGVREAQARGATPIAHSLELAAADFPAEGRKLIVLVTDGEESCGGDVRATLEGVRAQGIEIRIIGFDLDERAIAGFEGLGDFENTRSAGDLAAALGRSVEVDRLQTHRVTVTLTRDGVPVVDGVVVHFGDRLSDEEYHLPPTDGGVFEGDIPAGSYEARVEDAFGEEPLTFGGVNVTPDGGNAFAFELVQETEVALTVTPVDPVTGGTVTIRFEGAPAGDGNWITIVPAEAGDDVYLSYAEVTGSSGEIEVRVPNEAAMLEARYHLALPEGGTRVIGRSEPFDSVQATARLEVPAEVGVGSRFEVDWSGPDNPGDYVTIVPALAPDGEYAAYAYTRDGNPLILTAPVEPGVYEVRYQSDGDMRVIARSTTEVVGSDYALQAPAEVEGNAPFEVVWTGPGNPSDYITVVPAGAPAGQYLDYAYTREGNPVTLIAPVEPGVYEVRYSTEQVSPNPILAGIPLVVVAADYRLEAAAEVAAGASFEVLWMGPGNSRDYITIVPADAPDDAYLDYAYTREGNPVTLTAPAAAGDYEVRYAAEGVRGVFARLPIRVR